MWRIVFIGFLLVHAAIHLAIWATPATRSADAPFDASRSWLLGSQRSLALAAALGAAGLLAVAGIGLWAHVEWWRPVVLAGFAVSFGLMVLWFNPWFAFIEVVNASLLIGLAFYGWPSEEVLGA